MESTENSALEVRRDYTLHRTLIRDSFFAYLSENKRYPSNNELARRTGLSEKTIRNHLKNFDLAEITEPSKLFAENVLMSLIKRIQRTGDPSAVKLYLLLVFGIDERGFVANKKKDEIFSECTDEELNQSIIDLFTGCDIEFVMELHRTLGRRIAEEAMFDHEGNPIDEYKFDSRGVGAAMRVIKKIKGEIIMKTEEKPELEDKSKEELTAENERMLLEVLATLPKEALEELVKAKDLNG
jgi:hypothetical protein